MLQPLAQELHSSAEARKQPRKKVRPGLLGCLQLLRLSASSHVLDSLEATSRPRTDLLMNCRRAL